MRPTARRSPRRTRSGRPPWCALRGSTWKRAADLCEGAIAGELARGGLERRAQRAEDLVIGAPSGPDVFHDLHGALIPLRLRLPCDLASLFLQLIANRGLATMLLDFVRTWMPRGRGHRMSSMSATAGAAPPLGAAPGRNLGGRGIRGRLPNDRAI